MVAATILGYTIVGMWLVFWATLFTIVWLFFAFWPASIAKKKGHGFWGWFILSLFFWWITLFVALLMKDTNDKPATPAATPTAE